MEQTISINLKLPGSQTATLAVLKRQNTTPLSDTTFTQRCRLKMLCHVSVNFYSNDKLGFRERARSRDLTIDRAMIITNI